MTYDVSKAVHASAADTKEARMLRAVSAAYGGIPAAGAVPYGGLTAIADRLGVKPHDVSRAIYRARVGKALRGKLAPLQPGGLSVRLLVLERERPGLPRREQAKLLGTTPGMVRDTAYRLRRDGRLPYDDVRIVLPSGKRARKRGSSC